MLQHDTISGDVIIDAYGFKGVYKSRYVFHLIEQSLEITFSPFDSAIYRIAKRVFLKIQLKVLHV